MQLSFNSFNKIPFTSSKKVQQPSKKEGGVEKFEEKSAVSNFKLINKKEIKLESIEKACFNSLDEAHEYFLKEYGIDAEFKNFFQARITKDAIDSFGELNYQGKGKKLFEGLKINSNLESKTAYAAMCYRVKKDGKIFKKDTAAQEYIEIKKDKEIIADEMHISLNPSFEVWMQNQTKDNQFSASSYKDYIIHELTHYLHAKENPHDYLLSAYKRPIAQQKESLRQVSHYASKNLAEFVAEYAVARLNGRIFPKEIDELYKELRGPDLFKD